MFDCLGISLPGFRDSHFAVSEDAGTRTSPQRMHHYHVSRLAGGTLPKARQRPGPPHRAPVGSTVLRGLFLGGLRNAGEVRVSHVQALRGGQGGPEGERQPSSGRTRRDSGRGRAETASRRTASPTRPSPTAPNVKNNALRPNDFPRAFLSLPLLLPKALHPSHYKNPLSATQNPAAPFRLRDAPPRIRKPIMDAAPRTEQPRKRVHSQNG